MRIDDKFTFGKYQGRKLRDILLVDINYVGWCMENLNNFHLEPQNFETAVRTRYNQKKATKRMVAEKVARQHKEYERKIAKVK